MNEPQNKTAAGLSEKAAAFEIEHGLATRKRVVAIGASAGGLDALEVFFANMPKVDGLTFIVIQHQSADHDSHLAHILESKTVYPVKVISERMPVESSQVYILPPGVQGSIKDDCFRLRAISPDERPPFTINNFFIALAAEYNDRAVAIVLSGSGTDGAKGVIEVHSQGGTVIIQDPQSARFDGMPLSAAAMGCHDLVIRSEDMPDALLRLEATGTLLRSQSLHVDLNESDECLNRILEALQTVDGVDFSEYKTGTITRRIERRMVINRFQSVGAYTAFVSENGEELSRLHADLLIGVTRFFRDPLSFQAVERKVFPELIHRMRSGHGIRVWVPACSTGEEVYSLAMMLYESVDDIEPQPQIKIFATDIHPGSLASASVAMFHEDSLVDLSEGRLERHFIKDGDRYRVGTHLRQMVVFTRHNLLLDPPFTNVDFVSCRNLIMYFDENAQEQAIARMHFALRPKGFLFLGSAEQVNHYDQEFVTIDRAARIYRKRRDVRLIDISPMPIIKTPSMKWPQKNRIQERKQPAFDNERTNLDAVLEALVETGFVIDPDGQLLHTIGNIGAYLSIRPGPMRANIYDMLSPELKTTVLTCVLRAERTGKNITVSNVKHGLEDNAVTLDVVIRPLKKSETGQRNFLIQFEVKEDNANWPEADSHQSALNTSPEVRQLNEELELTRRSLRDMTEEVGARNEELQAVNEEVMSSNAELQTTNEELQSVNEELHTVNSEYQRKITELEVLTDDMTNLMTSTEIGTIFADAELRVRQFTDSVKVFFPLRRSDFGRPLDELASRLGFIDIDFQINDALTNGSTHRLEIQTNDSRWFEMRILPYRRQNSRIDGIVLTFVDVDTIKQAELEAERERERFRAIVEDQTELVCRFDQDFNLTFVNNAFCTYFGEQRNDLIGTRWLDRVHAEFRKTTVEQINSIAPRQAQVHERKLNLNNGETRWQQFTERAIVDEDNKIIEYQLVGRDITQEKEASELAAKQHAFYRALLTEAPAMLFAVSDAGEITKLSRRLANRLGYDVDAMVGRRIKEFVSSGTGDKLERHLNEITPENNTKAVPYEFVSAAGEIVRLSLSASFYPDQDTQPYRVLAVLNEIH